jgi:rhodanese-related sulfurtransferase
MPVDLNSKEGLIIRKLIPLATLPSKPLKALCANMVIEEINNDFLFKKGDTDTRLVYLISGTVALQAQNWVIETIDAQSESARFALAHQIPRKIDAFAKGPVRFLRLHADIVNSPPPLVYQKDESYIVTEEEDDANAQDWMTSLLKSPLFQPLAPANLQKILISLDIVEYKKGTVILEQGHYDEYYYIIKSGTCLVTHKTNRHPNETKLAQISKGNTLGEEALIFDEARTETITALTDVSLARLTKQQFISLIKVPLLQSIDFSEVQKIMATGAILLDIRPSHEYQEHHINGSINIPFPWLKNRYKTLDSQHPIIITGNHNQSREAAAFLLIKHRYSVFILKTGIPDKEPNLNNEDTLLNPTTILLEAADEDMWQPAIPYLDINAPIEDDFPAQITELEAENAVLKKNYAQLSQQYTQLQAEKTAIEKQCRILTKQVEKLTQVLNKFKMVKTKLDTD